MTNNCDAQLAAKLDIVYEKQKLIDAILGLTLGVSQQIQGLEDLILITHPAQEFPEEVVRYIDELPKNVKESSEPALKKNLNTLNKAVEKTVFDSLALVEMDEDELLAHVSSDNNEAQITQSIFSSFKRQCQTNLAVRALLRKMHSITKPLKLNVPVVILKSKARHLKVRERNYRNKAKNKIEQLLTEVEILLELPQLPSEMRKSLLQTQSILVTQLKCLTEGKPIQQIPTSEQVLEIIKQTQKHDSSEQSTKALDTLTAEIKSTHIGQQETKPVKEQAVKQDTTPPPLKCFLGRLGRWIMSPPNTKWKDIDPR